MIEKQQEVIHLERDRLQLPLWVERVSERETWGRHFRSGTWKKIPGKVKIYFGAVWNRRKVVGKLGKHFWACGRRAGENNFIMLKEMGQCLAT